jgi:hypothetical protein
MGGETNSLRSDKFPLFFHFPHRITGWLQAELPNRLAFGIALSSPLVLFVCSLQTLERI